MCTKIYFIYRHNDCRHGVEPAKITKDGEIGWIRACDRALASDENNKTKKTKFCDVLDTELADLRGKCMQCQIEDPNFRSQDLRLAQYEAELVPRHQKELVRKEIEQKQRERSRDDFGYVIPLSAEEISRRKVEAWMRKNIAAGAGQGKSGSN
jgi:hypothetical protein